MTEDDWEDIDGAGVTTGSGYVTALKAEVGALQDTSADAISWMDAFYCTDTGSMPTSFQCTAYQPDYDQVSQGYPRFGVNESNANDL